MAAGLLLTGVAWAAALQVTSERMAAATLPVPAFHPTSLTITPAKGKAGGLNKADALDVAFSGRLLVTTVCAGALTTTVTQTITGVTVRLADGGTGSDTLSVTAGPLTCAAPKVGTFDLGSTEYVSGAAVDFVADLTLTQETGTSRLTLVLGNSSSNRYGAPTTATVVRYLPDAALGDTAGAAVTGTASTASGIQF